MANPIISDKAFSILKQLSKEFAELKNIGVPELEKEKNKKWKAVYLSLLYSISNFELLTSFLELSFIAINNLGNAIDKLPDEQEFNSVREELEKTKGQVTQTLTPIQKLLDESIKQQKRGISMDNESYHYIELAATQKLRYALQDPN